MFNLVKHWKQQGEIKISGGMTGPSLNFDEIDLIVSSAIAEKFLKNVEKLKLE